MAGRLTPRRRRLAGGVMATALVGGVAAWTGPTQRAAADTSPGPTVGNPPLPCQPEQFPHAGAPRSAPSVPYEIPFTATLGPDPAPLAASSGQYPAGTEAGGWLEIKGTSRLIAGAQVDVTLGGPVVNGKGFVYAQGCGRVQLPSETGGLGADHYQPTGTGGEVNPNFTFYPATPVSIGITPPGIPIPTGINIGSPLVAYGSADGFLASTIERTPAANGGLNVNFYSTAKSTTNFAGVLGLLGGASGQCTVAIGDLRETGVQVPAGGIGGLNYAQATTPVHLSTTQSVPDPSTGQPDAGQPVTGPIAPDETTKPPHNQSSAVLAANNFPVAAIVPQMPPSPNYPGTATCSQSNANMMNNLIGLPNPAGRNFFYAPGTFGVFTSS